MKIFSYKELNVWKESFSLVLIIYEITSKLPKSEMYGLVNQMRRASVGIPSNIAEGFKRNNTREFIQFLGIANGSSAELETQLMIASAIYSLEISRAISKITSIQKMLSKLINALRNKIN